MKEDIVDIISKSCGIGKGEVERLLEIPPKQEMGDYAFPCFILSSKEKKAPALIANDLSLKISKKLSKNIEKVTSNGPYLNFFINKNAFASSVLNDVFKKDYGKSRVEKHSIGIEFSQPNTHKAFHVGHIRGTSIGESLSRINEFFGNKVVRINYSGDTGMHIAKWVWCYVNFHSSEKISDDETWIAGIYVDAVKRLGENESLQEEVDEINRKIESGSDKKINDLWNKTRKLSIKSWDKIYKQLNSKFDKHYFESEMQEEGNNVANDLLDRKIAKKDDAVFMDLENYGLSKWVLLRKDGTTLYSAKDLALAIIKEKELKLDKYLVCVAEEQDLHFRQLRKTLELMNFKKAKDYTHLAFGLVRLPDGKMSSRSGKNILYSQFYDEVFNLAKEGIVSRGYTGGDIDNRAQKISIAAIKYPMLRQDTSKTLIFNPQEAVSFEGDTGPYLLYSYARANSILKKINKKTKKDFEIKRLEEKEISLIKEISKFSVIILKSYQDNSPNLLANYSFSLSQKFNEFYHSCPVLGNENEGFRLRLVEAFRIVLGKSLDLLGIETLEEM